MENENFLQFFLVRGLQSKKKIFYFVQVVVFICKNKQIHRKKYNGLAKVEILSI